MVYNLLIPIFTKKKNTYDFHYAKCRSSICEIKPRYIPTITKANILPRRYFFLFGRLYSLSVGVIFYISPDV